MSSSTGKLIRLQRLIESGKNTCLIVAIDHGMTSPAMTAAIRRIFRDGWPANQADQELQAALQALGQGAGA